MNFSQNWRYAVRLLGKRPFFSLAIIVTMGVCIGAVTAVFSVVDATLLKPLPYPEPERLVQLATYSEYRGQSGLQTSQDGTAWGLFKESSSAVDLAVISAGITGVSFSSGNTASYVQQQRVSAGFFRVMGMQPAIGREFTAEEDRAGGPPVAALSHAFWRRAFRSDPALVGQAAMIGGQPVSNRGHCRGGFPFQW